MRERVSNDAEKPGATARGVPEESVGHGREPGARWGTGRSRDGESPGVSTRQRKTNMEGETLLLRKLRHRPADGLENHSGDGEGFEATAESTEQSAVRAVRHQLECKLVRLDILEVQPPPIRMSFIIRVDDSSSDPLGDRKSVV